jgi:molecular chaperone HtpG
MQVPETPKKVSDLALMQQLERYATGDARWDSQVNVGPQAQTACKALHVNVTQLVEKALAPMLDRITSREMDTFTMHDRTHGLKVAHLMWQILTPSRRERLTPPEIALLVLAAHFHDIGMALSKEERAERLRPSSSLWEKLDIDEGVKERMERLGAEAASTDVAVSRRARPELNQMEEALLSQDTRERHATRERYDQVLSALREFHHRDPENVPGIDECLSFDGNSFRDKLVDICVSHNEDAEALVRRDAENPARPRLPTNFPIGACTADLHMVAAALRLTDILDFDRERTPSVLFYYLLPTDLAANENRSILEWGKHMSISHWHIDEDALVFRGRCKDHIIHHAIVLFCAAIQEEIHATRATFGALKEQASWPFNLPGTVTNEIHEDGYHYVPYRFELDDQRIYSLLMGGAIYDNPLVAVRELVQNAVDACKLRDALTQFYEPYSPVTTNRIFVTYEEPNETHDLPLLRVSDTGTGMDAFILQRYFLKVGQSYYNSQEFKRERLELRKNNLDFAPISEFGIGFLSCFLLADRVQVETAMSESPRGDVRKRTLLIDGPTRLIRLNEEPNEGSRRFKGTRISLYLSRRGGRAKSLFPQWGQIKEYLESVCRELPTSSVLKRHRHLRELPRPHTSKGRNSPLLGFRRSAYSNQRLRTRPRRRDRFDESGEGPGT